MMAKMDRAIVFQRQRGLGAGILSGRRMLTHITSTLRGRQPPSITRGWQAALS